MRRGKGKAWGLAAAACCAFVLRGHLDHSSVIAAPSEAITVSLSATEPTAGVAVCASERDCDDRQACTNDVCYSGACLHILLPDCVACNAEYHCNPVEIVFLMDTSGSMRDEAAALCAGVDQLVLDLNALGIEVTPYLYGITETPGGEFGCLTGSVTALFPGPVPGDASACPFPNSLSAYESWGPATAIVAQRFSWAPLSTRIIVPMSDEGPCDGSRPEGCADPGSDRNSITNAITIAQANGVIVSPVSGTGSDSCVLNLGRALADGTGGIALESKNPQADLSDTITQVILNRCASPDRCDDHHACTTDDSCIGGACVGTPVVECEFDECLTDVDCEDYDACTTDTCNTVLGICQRPYIAGFDPVSECCDPAFGGVTTRDDGDGCTDDVCSLPHSRGAAEHPILPSTTPCLDGNPCTTGDHCDGVHTQADGGCAGQDVNTFACQGGVCPVPNEFTGDRFECTRTGWCACTMDLHYTIVNSGKEPECEGGASPNRPCVGDSDCPGGFCNEFAHGGNCFNRGDKIEVRVHLGSAGAPIDKGVFQLTYDPSCVTLNSVSGIAPYTMTVYGPLSGPGSVAIGVSVDRPNEVDGPWGDADILDLSFAKLGECDECDLCFGDNDPETEDTYLVDNAGQHLGVVGDCKAIRERPDLTLDVPTGITADVDCDVPTARVTWSPPVASSDCGPATLSCRGRHESGLEYPSETVLNGGVFPIGTSNFCCFTAENWCNQAAGCADSLDDCFAGTGGDPAGCWTVEVRDQTTLEFNVQLSPPITHNDANGELTRCIKVCLFSTLTELPECFSQDVTFGGLFNFPGQGRGRAIIPGTTQWRCITAQDQLHTLRSCYFFTNTTDCVGGVLHAEFTGDPGLEGNWLIGGNVDGWQKDDDDPTTIPSLDVIDILDVGMFIGQMGIHYPDNDTPCGTEGPNVDINGDGVADTSDYNFIIRNFLRSSKECCGQPQTGSASAGGAVTEISVDELHAMGLDNLAVADLNGDGLLNIEDMDAFLAGARPSKSSNNRDGKGPRPRR